jgi:hypothetical protein
VQLCLDILKLSLLLQETDNEDFPGLSEEQRENQKYFTGLKKALEEMTPATKMPAF